jgi:hypothetical protein
VVLLLPLLLLLLKPVLFFGMIYVKSRLQSKVPGFILSRKTDVLYHTQLRTQHEHGALRNVSCPSKYRIPYFVKTIRSITELFPHSFMIRPSNMTHPYANRSPSTVILIRGSTSYNLYSGYSTKSNHATSAFYEIKPREICVPRSDFFEAQFLWVATPCPGPNGYRRFKTL